MYRLKVINVESGGAADSAGIRVGDILDSYDGVDMATPKKLKQATSRKKSKTHVITIIRNDTLMNFACYGGELGVTVKSVDVNDAIYRQIMERFRNKIYKPKGTGLLSVRKLIAKLFSVKFSLILSLLLLILGSALAMEQLKIIGRGVHANGEFVELAINENEELISAEKIFFGKDSPLTPVTRLQYIVNGKVYHKDWVGFSFMETASIMYDKNSPENMVVVGYDAIKLSNSSEGYLSDNKSYIYGMYLVGASVAILMFHLSIFLLKNIWRFLVVSTKISQHISQNASQNNATLPVHCPFCRSHLPAGATVCGHCNAFKDSVLARQPAITQFIIFGNWVFFGPAPVALWLFTDAFKSAGFFDALPHIAVTVFGYIILANIANVTRWYRYN